MVLDVFHPWPRDALVGVAQRFMVVLSEKNIQDEESRIFEDIQVLPFDPFDSPNFTLSRA